jgi:hypothetical protein
MPYQNFQHFLFIFLFLFFATFPLLRQKLIEKLVKASFGSSNLITSVKTDPLSSKIDWLASFDLHNFKNQIFNKKLAGFW